MRGYTDSAPPGRMPTYTKPMTTDAISQNTSNLHVSKLAGPEFKERSTHQVNISQRQLQRDSLQFRYMNIAWEDWSLIISLWENRVSRSEHRASGVSLLGWTHQNSSFEPDWLSLSYTHWTHYSQSPPATAHTLAASGQQRRGMQSDFIV